MKFIKGVIVGTMVSAGIWMVCSEDAKCRRNKMMKQGRKIMRNIGII